MDNEILKSIELDYNKAVIVKDFLDNYFRSELSRIYKEFETSEIKDMIYLQSELKAIKGLQNKLNNIILMQESIDSYKDKLK